MDELARYLARQHPDLKGFTRRNLFRMRQFYGIYHLDKKVAPLVRQLPWTHNLLILSRNKRPEEREFCLRLCLRERWSKRELERQLAGALFERTVLSPPKVSPLVTQIHPAAETMFKETYLLDFLDLPEVHSEAGLLALTPRPPRATPTSAPVQKKLPSPPPTWENPPGHDRFRVTHHVHPPQCRYGGRATEDGHHAPQFQLSAFQRFCFSPVVPWSVVTSPISAFCFQNFSFSP